MPPPRPRTPAPSTVLPPISIARPLTARKGEVMGLLGDTELQQFAAEGYLLLRGVVGESLLGPADGEIDDVMAHVAPNEGQMGVAGQHAWFIPRHRLPGCEDMLRR